MPSYKAVSMDKSSPLPPGVRPRGFCRTAAAAYVGVGASLFDEMVLDGRMPKPKLVNTRIIWDAIALDEAFDDLPTKGIDNPWDASYC